VQRVLLKTDHFFSDVDYGELLLLANIELLDEFAMDFHQFLLKDRDLVFVFLDAAAI
jgi:hypothetical protein